MASINEAIQLLSNKKDKISRLQKYIRDIDNKTFKTADVLNLMLDIANPIFVASNPENVFDTKDITKDYREEIKRRLPLILPQIAEFFKCKESEICLGNYNRAITGMESCDPKPVVDKFNETFPNAKDLTKGQQVESAYSLTLSYEREGEVCPYTVVLGDVCLAGLAGLGNLRCIGGNAEFFACVDGSDLVDCYDKSMGQLEIICGDAVIGWNSYWTTCKEIPTLGHIKLIGGDLKMEDARINSLGDLRVVGGDVYSDFTEIEGLDKILVIGKIYTSQG